MNLAEEIITNKEFSAKQKSNAIFRLIQESKIEFAELIRTANSSSDSDKASCIEALELYTRANPQNATLAILEFVTESLKEKAPRIKWESARVIENIAQFFPSKLESATKNLIANTNHTGKVVRWSAAKALAKILYTNVGLQANLESICNNEKEKSIQKIYVAALKKMNK